MQEEYGIPFHLDYSIEKYDILNAVNLHRRNALRAVSQYRKQIEHNFELLKANELGNDNMVWQNEYKEGLNHLAEVTSLVDDSWDVLILFHGYATTKVSDILRTLLKLREIDSENKWVRVMIFELNKRLIKLEESLVTAQQKTKVHYYLYMMRWRGMQTETAAHAYLDEGDDEMMEIEEPITESVRSIYNLFCDYLQMRRFDVLEKLLEENIDKYKVMFGVGSLEVASIMSMLAKVFEEQEKFQESQNVQSQVLLIRENRLGLTHDLVGITKFRLSVINFKRKLYKDAETNASSALAIRQKILDKSHADIAVIQAHLGHICINLGKWNDALFYYKPAVSLFEEIYEENDIFIIRCHMNMSLAYIKTQQFEKANEMLDRLCREYQTKNMTISFNAKESVFTKIVKNSKSANLTTLVTQLYSKYGRFDKVLEKAIYELMLEYFNATKQTESSQVLQGWANYKPADAIQASKSKRKTKDQSIEDNVDKADDDKTEKSKKKKREKGSSIASLRSRFSHRS